MIKAVLFDLDNTLTDFLRMKRTSVDAAVSAMIDAGLPMKKEKALKTLWELYDDYGIEYGEILQEFLMKSLGKIDYNMLSRGIIAYRRVKAGFLEPYPHVISTLIRLKERGYRLAVVSDAPRMRASLSHALILARGDEDIGLLRGRSHKGRRPREAEAGPAPLQDSAPQARSESG